MGYSPSALKNPGRLLFGFNEATTTSLGDIVLLVQAGLVTLNVQFSMVDDLSPYNEIHSLYLPSYGELPHGGGTSRSPWQSASCVPMLSSDTRFRTSSRQGGEFGIIKYKGAITVTKLYRERSIYS